LIKQLNGGEKMDTCKNEFITGYKKFIFFQYLKIYVFVRYTSFLLIGRISFNQYKLLIKRALLFLEKVKINKVVKTRGVYKLHIYFPAFPTKAFFIALDKFLTIKTDELNPYPTSVLVSIGKGCGNKCKHCYQRFDKREDLPIEKLKEVFKKLQELKISFINIEGGEPMLKFDRLKEVMSVIDERSEVWVNTSGFLVTKKKAEEMRKTGVFGVMVSLHHWNENKHDKFVGRKGSFKEAVKSLEIFKNAGLSTAINCVGTQELLKDNGFEKIMEIAKKEDCAIVQLIHEKPAGAWINKKDTLKKNYIEKLCNYHLMYNANNNYKNYPAVSSQAFESQPENFGCTAGGIERFYINGNGDVQPCEFVNVSFGNVNEEDFIQIYKKMRRIFNKPRQTWICCTEHGRINKELKKIKSMLTPLSKEKSKKIIKNFNLGKETALYSKMELY